MAFEFTHEMRSVVLHVVAATAVGILSPTFAKSLAIFMGIGVLVGLNLIVKFVFKKQETKWWLANGLWPYLMTWLAVWTVAMNL